MEVLRLNYTVSLSRCLDSGADTVGLALMGAAFESAEAIGNADLMRLVPAFECRGPA
jgi:hypothetical protein